MLEVKNINFNWKKKFFVRDVSFSLEDGYMMCLLGKNGAGKTTLLRLLYGMMIPESGTVSYEGTEAVKKSTSSAHAKRMVNYHKDVAYIEDDMWCSHELTAAENADVLGNLYEFDRQEFEAILKRFEFTETDKNTKYDRLSTGQKMQLRIAFSLARHPKLFIMDEPLANLDPVIKEDILELLQDKIAKENISVILSTHLVEEITDMVDYIGIMEDGRLQCFGDREEVFRRYGTDSLRELLKENDGYGL